MARRGSVLEERSAGRARGVTFRGTSCPHWQTLAISGPRQSFADSNLSAHRLGPGADAGPTPPAVRRNLVMDRRFHR